MKVIIDGQEYDDETLTENARAQLTSLQMADAKIAQLQADLAIAQTARNAYAKALSEEVQGTEG